MHTVTEKVPASAYFFFRNGVEYVIIEIIRAGKTYAFEMPVQQVEGRRG